MWSKIKEHEKRIWKEHGSFCHKTMPGDFNLSAWDCGKGEGVDALKINPQIYCTSCKAMFIKVVTVSSGGSRKARCTVQCLCRLWRLEVIFRYLEGIFWRGNMLWQVSCSFKEQEINFPGMRQFGKSHARQFHQGLGVSELQSYPSTWKNTLCQFTFTNSSVYHSQRFRRPFM